MCGVFGSQKRIEPAPDKSGFPMDQSINPLGGGATAAAPGSLCMCRKLNGSQCGKPAVNGLCSRHRRVEELREERRKLRETQKQNFQSYRLVLRQFAIANPDTDDGAIWEILSDLVARNVITYLQQRKVYRAFMDALARARNARKPKPELQQFAEDSQNVHRKAVTDQTNDHTEKLLAVTVPSEQNTLKEIRGLFGKSRKVMTDVEHWYALTMCRKEADCLYKRTLDGLWALIKTSEHKEELCKRLKEELTDAVGLCCEGHLSRLCNVLAGFHDAFSTVVSKGEILQQKMSAIAALDVTIRTKKMRARAVLAELDIPKEEHAAWLDAF